MTHLSARASTIAGSAEDAHHIWKHAADETAKQQIKTLGFRHKSWLRPLDHVLLSTPAARERIYVDRTRTIHLSHPLTHIYVAYSIFNMESLQVRIHWRGRWWGESLSWTELNGTDTYIYLLFFLAFGKHKLWKIGESYRSTLKA